ncbi:segregation/condensation protein A [archaeon]|nr:segregation/condensation protein A [archaeon]
MQDQILDMLMKKDEITWQDLIKNLVKSEHMDPWNVDLSLLSKKYIDIVKQLKDVNFFVSGKVVLASAILLKLKTNKLLTHNIANFDSQLFASDEEEEFEQEYIGSNGDSPKVRLTIKTPQARKRRVLLTDLIGALEKALDVDERRSLRRARYDRIPDTIKLPDRQINLGDRIKGVYNKINLWFVKNKCDLEFNHLLDEGSKEDKVLTFIPLLHLETQRKVNIKQIEDFGNIYIRLNSEIRK